MSLLDNEEDLINNNNELIHDFLKKNYVIDDSYTIKNDVVDVNDDIFIKNFKTKFLTNGLFSFGVVNSDFYCHFCESLISLKGAPKKVDDDFIFY